MPGLIGSLRRLALTPSLRSTGFAARGFPGATSPAAARLEAIPQTVVCGFEWGIDARDRWELERKLELVEVDLRGFAYEGAAMATTVRDAMGRGTRTRDLLLGGGRPHLLLSYIGIGFAMARLPRPLWAKVLPDLDELPWHPTAAWLVVDGYGFDLAYFHTERWVHRQELPKPYPWLGDSAYFTRAFDQGVGRALWFIHGARTADVAAAVAKFPAARHADLWSGVGLAAAFAGGCDDADLVALRHAAGGHRAELALGAALAAKARAAAGSTPPHTAAATDVLTGVPAAEAAALVDRTAVHERGAADVPPYELWRARIRAEFAERASSRTDSPGTGGHRAEPE
ncbi:DUF1702 family protein [Saccharothrix obliqua]|uniref:DUF1702 family protein n=1 Tax=Saccharothrix obliqua TaxID=2861747 RepID=UPI001C5E4675|nr:DUF1702 family protein [Saccharothrix obliqua]MBW4721817.1 DUF1702 family protein [Saccharothrix obliqua]